MNPAIEYILRNKRAHNLLSLPCSLFLVTASGHKIVVTINNFYGDDKYVVVKHWKTWLTKPEDRLPPFSEFKVPREELFCSPYTILDTCSIMPYNEDPFPCGGKQYADDPQGSMQVQEYESYMTSQYNTVSHQERRLNWLWEAFENIYIQEDLRFKYGHGHSNGMELQREIVQFYSRPIWYTWQYWKKHLLDFKVSAAAELVFRRDYVKSEKSPEIYPTITFQSPTSFTSGNFYVTSGSWMQN